MSHQTKPPRAPAWLSKDAKAEWRRSIPLLIARGALSVHDLAMFAHYCVAVGRAAEAQRIINEQGIIVGPAHRSRKHPACGVQAEAMTQARQYAAELGLTPVSRSKLKVRDVPADDGPSPLDA